MLGLVALLLIVWIALGILGAVVHGLFWLTVVAVVLLILTSVFGGSRLRRRRAPR